MTLSWYINRLRSMDAAEILHRVVEKSRKFTSRHLHQGWSRYKGARLHPVMPRLKGRVLAATPAQRQAITQAASDILAGHYSALGANWPQRPADIGFSADLWRLDPITQTHWPKSDQYAFAIDYRHRSGRGDIKYVWEINRLQFLPVLAAQHVLEEDAQSLDTIETVLTSWYEANPPFGGVGWASGIEVALRAISIILTLSLIGDRLSSGVREKAGDILSASAFWLPRFPSHFSSANNHLVAELAGEVLIERALGRSTGWAWTHLLGELEKQILPDGAGAEQTPTYAAFTAELVLTAAMAEREAGTELPARALERLRAFADFIGWIGLNGEYGDNDEGRVVSLGEEASYPASVASAIASFVDRKSGWYRADDFRALVFGRPADVFSPLDGLRVFSAGGLSVWRGEMANHAAVLRFDHGPLGYLSIAAHGHADALAITLEVDGQPVLVDPGTYLYGSGGAWRDWFRSTPAHNTLNLGQQSQSVMSGAFNWSHKARAWLVESHTGTDWSLIAEHNGYERRFGARHRREVLRDGQAIVITDRLIGTPQQAEIVFQLAPGLVSQQVGKVVTVSRGGLALLRIELPNDAITIQSGGDAPGQGGWVSQGFGVKVPAARICWRGEVDSAGVQSFLRVLDH